MKLLVFRVCQRVLLSSPGCWGVCCTSVLWICGGKHPPKLFPSQWSSVWTKQSQHSVKDKDKYKIFSKRKKESQLPNVNLWFLVWLWNPCCCFFAQQGSKEETEWGSSWGLSLPGCQGREHWQHLPEHGKSHPSTELSSLGLTYM